MYVPGAFSTMIQRWIDGDISTFFIQRRKKKRRKSVEN